MEFTNSQTPDRISVVDSLRGFAVVGIILIHFLEHLNFYSFPELTAFDKGLWDVVFYLGASKMYAIFALLFGFSCYIQHNNRERRGIDFRPRFAWRMLLLFLWGAADLVFFNGDILCTYAVLGLFLIPLVRVSDRLLVVVALFLFFQPIEIFYLIRGLTDPSALPMDLSLGQHWSDAYEACAEGGFWDVALTNLRCGLQINFGWAIEHGRLTQTVLLFVVGMIAGRKRLFLGEPRSLAFWRKALGGAVVMFVPTQLLLLFLPFDNMAPCVAQSLDILITAWRNLSMMIFYVGTIIILYYTTAARKAISHLSCIGKMSLTSYLLQSIVGGFLFYNWGLSLYLYCGHTLSFLLGMAFCMCLYLFCRFWTKGHRRGPLEEIWAKATNVTIQRIY